MPSVAVDVSVTNGGVVVDLLKARPVRLIPSGHAGVVFAGSISVRYRSLLAAMVLGAVPLVMLQVYGARRLVVTNWTL